MKNKLACFLLALLLPVIAYAAPPIVWYGDRAKLFTNILEYADGTIVGHGASGDIAYGWGNHASAGYVVGPELDPVYSADPAFTITSDQIASWDIAYGWGDHSTEGYLKSVVAIADGGTGQTTANDALNALLPAQNIASAGYILQSDGTNTNWASLISGELDPVFSAAPAFGITSDQVASWDIAYGWGDHSLVGYLTAETDPIYSADPAFTITSDQIASWDMAYGWGDHSLIGYLTAETDPIYSADPAFTITSDQIASWDIAYGWGDHPAETDPVYSADPAFSITSPQIASWDVAYAWGNHASQGYMIGNPSIAGAVGANALTMALKTEAGGDPSASIPVCVKMRSSTAGSGEKYTRCATAALSTVISSGSTAGFVSGTTRFLYWYLIDVSGTLELAWSARRIHTEISSNNGLVTTVAEGGAGAADSYAVYSTTQRTAVPFILVGRTTHSLTTAGTWDEAPDAITLAPFEMEPMSLDWGKSTTSLTKGDVVVVVFSTKRYDTHSLYNSGTGVVTVIEDGDYSISSNFLASITPEAAPREMETSIFIDGVEKVNNRRTSVSTSAQSCQFNPSTTMYLTAGQTIDIRVYQNLHTSAQVPVDSASYTRLSVSRIK